MGAHLIFEFSRGGGVAWFLYDKGLHHDRVKEKKFNYLNWLNFRSKFGDGPLNDGGKKYFFKVLLLVAAQYMSSIYTRRSWKA